MLEARQRDLQLQERTTQHSWLQMADSMAGRPTVSFISPELQSCTLNEVNAMVDSVLGLLDVWPLNIYFQQFTLNHSWLACAYNIPFLGELGWYITWPGMVSKYWLYCCWLVVFNHRNCYKEIEYDAEKRAVTLHSLPRKLNTSK